jgi:hypothetical protein
MSPSVRVEIAWMVATGRQADFKRLPALDLRHSGGSVGGTAHLIIYPDDSLVVAVLVNSDYTFIRATPSYAEPFLPRSAAAAP